MYLYRIGFGLSDLLGGGGGRFGGGFLGGGRGGLLGGGSRFGLLLVDEGREKEKQNTNAPSGRGALGCCSGVGGVVVVATKIVAGVCVCVTHAPSTHTHARARTGTDRQTHTQGCQVVHNKAMHGRVLSVQQRSAAVVSGWIVLVLRFF